MVGSVETFEDDFRAIWTARKSTPYPGQLDVPKPREARIAVRDAISGNLERAENLFRRCPALSVWATLAPLADHYAEENPRVYEHIETELGLERTSQNDRNRLKEAYRQAANSIGVSVEGNDPNDLFFPLLGVADAQLAQVADAFVKMLAEHGPPATEDTHSAVTWQRRAMKRLPQAITRPKM